MESMEKEEKLLMEKKLKKNDLEVNPSARNGHLVQEIIDCPDCKMDENEERIMLCRKHMLMVYEKTRDKNIEEDGGIRIA